MYIFYIKQIYGGRAGKNGNGGGRERDRINFAQGYRVRKKKHKNIKHR